MGQGNPKADPKAPEHHDVPAPDSDRHTAAKPIAGAKKPAAHAQSPHAADGSATGGGGGGGGGAIPGGPDGLDGDVAMGQAGAVAGAGVGMGMAMGAGAMRADVDERGLPMGTPSSLTDRVARFLNKAGPPNAAGAGGQVPVGSVGAGAGGLSASPRFDDLLVPEPKQIETVSTLFKWTGGGSEVFLTGSFNNWQGKIRMQRNAPGAPGAAAPSPNTSSNALVLADSASSAAPTRVQVAGAPAPAAGGQPGTAMALLTGAAGAGAGGGAGASAGAASASGASAPSSAAGVEFALVIDIPPGIHQYKYIVDEQWRINPDAPTTTNAQGVVNNIIEVKRPVFEDNLSAFADSDEEELDENKQKIAYGQRVPAPDEYAKEPPKIPPQLGNILLNAPVSPADPYLLPTPQHVTLNHMYVYGYGKSPGESEVLVTGITQRFKTKSFINATPKFVTTVFYSPKPQIAF